MLIPHIYLPPSFKYTEGDKKLQSFFNYIDHLQLLGFVLLDLSPSWDQGGKTELIKVIQRSAVFMSGFTNEDVDLAGALLDKGLRVAFFAQQSVSVTMEALSRLPRQRVGLSVIDTPASADR